MSNAFMLVKERNYTRTRTPIAQQFPELLPYEDEDEMFVYQKDLLEVYEMYPMGRTPAHLEEH